MQGQIIEVGYWFEGMGYSDAVEIVPGSPPSLALGTALWLGAAWENGGAEIVTGKVQMTVFKPDGSVEVLTSYENNESIGGPGGGAYVTFNPVILDQLGDYDAHVELLFEPVGGNGNGEVTTVDVTVRQKNAPGNAVTWFALCNTYQSMLPVALASDILWVGVPPNTPVVGIIFGCKDASGSDISCPNCNIDLGWSTPFQDGGVYYWNFATGMFEDSNGNIM